MARSTTVWAAALVLASFSGSGPLLTTAEAMPAPGPQETQMRPRYYFPRHVKRQIVTNSTAPAAATSSSSTLSKSSSELESREVPGRVSSFVESLFGNKPDSSSNLVVSKSGAELTSTVTSIQDIVVTPVPDRPDRPGRLPGTGNLRQTPSNSNSGSSNNLNAPGSSSIAPTPTPQAPESQPSNAPSSPQQAASTGVLPPLVVPASSSAAPATPTAPSTAPVSSQGGGNAVSSLLGGVLGPTGLLPSSVIQPTPASSAPQSSAPAASSFVGPFIVPGSSASPAPSSQGLVGGLVSTLLPEPTPTPQVGSTGVLPSSIVSPTSAAVVQPSNTPLVVQPSSSGIVVGITTALGTGAPSPTPSGAVPTSESVLVPLPSILSSVVSEVGGILPSGSAGPTAPITPSPTPTPSGILPPLVSSLVSDVSSLLSSAAPELPPSAVPSLVSSLVSEGPIASSTGPIVLPPVSSVVSSILSDFSSGILPTPSGVVPTPSGGVPTVSPVPSSIVPSETPTVPSSVITPTVSPSAIESPGITPSAAFPPTGSVSSGVVPTPTSSAGSINIPASEEPKSTGIPSSVIPILPSSGNATVSDAPITSAPASATDSPTLQMPTTPSIFSRPTPVNSQRPISFDSATSMVIPTIIVQESASNSAPTPTSSGIPSGLPKVIAPPGGVPNDVSTDSFMGQVCFKWPLNYPFVSQNDGGKQIFYYLPKAIAAGLNITNSEVKNMGLRPLDTTAYQGFITTLALFTIPKDLMPKLQASLRNPADPFWHNDDQTVNDLTALINTACPLPAGRVPGDGSNANPAGNPAATASGGSGDGGALGGDIGASRPINGSAAGIATGAIMGAIAYGAAMFFVARRYRNKRLAHARSSSVPSTNSRMTYGSIPGGAAAWMHGARNGRITPGSRGSRGSDSSQGRSVRTQQISAPVMAENSLGWN